MTDDRVFAIKFYKVYPLYVQKAERKNRTKVEVDVMRSFLSRLSVDSCELVLFMLMVLPGCEGHHA